MTTALPLLPRWRLHLLRAFYVFMALGLALHVGPSLLQPGPHDGGAVTVVRAVLGALGLLALVGIWRPVQMLPVLVFELLWKLIWLGVFGLPLMLAGQADAAAQESFWACVLGVVLLPLVLPWAWMLGRLREPGRSRPQPSAASINRGPVRS
jgi:hypothetical protein